MRWRVVRGVWRAGGEEVPGLGFMVESLGGVGRMMSDWRKTTKRKKAKASQNQRPQTERFVRGVFCESLEAF